MILEKEQEIKEEADVEPELQNSSSDLNNKKFNFTQLHKLTGISTRHIARVLKGQCKNPSFESIRKLSEALNMSMDNLNNYIDSNKSNNNYLGGRVLTSEQVREIIELKDKDESNTRNIADKYKVSRQTISNIWNSNDVTTNTRS